MLARTVLNRNLRPFTARWHQRRESGHLAQQDQRRAFRKELAEIQKVLAKPVELLGRLAIGEAYSCDPVSRAHHEEFDGARVWPDGFEGPEPESSPPGTTPPRTMWEMEIAAILLRRLGVYGGLKAFKREFGGLGPSEDSETESMGLVGLAISGGGDSLGLVRPGRAPGPPGT